MVRVTRGMSNRTSPSHEKPNVLGYCVRLWAPSTEPTSQPSCDQPGSGRTRIPNKNKTGDVTTAQIAISAGIGLGRGIFAALRTDRANERTEHFVQRRAEHGKPDGLEHLRWLHMNRTHRELDLVVVNGCSDETVATHNSLL